VVNGSSDSVANFIVVDCSGSGSSSDDSSSIRRKDSFQTRMIAEVVLEVRDSIRSLTLDWVGESIVIQVLKGSPGRNSLASSSPLADHVSTDCAGS